MPVNTIVLNQTVEVGKTIRLHVTAMDLQNRPAPITGSITWATANGAIASIVFNATVCDVLGVAAGQVVITATAAGLTATFNVTVTPAVTPTNPIATLIAGQVT